MSKKTWIILIAVVVGFAGLFIWLANKPANKIDLSPYNIAEIIPPSADNGEIGDHVLGNPDSKVVLVEYGDFQCPMCSSVASRIKAIAELYKEDIAFVFRNFPLPNMHQNAKAAAATAEAAGLQGKYWEMNEYIYKNQGSWSSLRSSSRNDWFAGAATALGLDSNQLLADMTSDAVTKKINFDLSIATEIQAAGTPVFYLNGEVVDIETWEQDASLKSFLNEKIKEITGEPAKAEAKTTNATGSIQ